MKKPPIEWCVRYVIAAYMFAGACQIMGRWITPEQAKAMNALADTFINDPRYKLIP